MWVRTAVENHAAVLTVANTGRVVDPATVADLFAAPGQTVVHATSSTQEVVVQIDPAQASEVHADDGVTITLADGTTTPGTITNVAKVAVSAPSSPGGSANSLTVEVDIAPKDKAARSAVNDASVQVAITTASVQNALSVPVTVLLAQAGGGYAVEVVGADGTHGLVPVKLGIFDDGAGLAGVAILALLQELNREGTTIRSSWASPPQR